MGEELYEELAELEDAIGDARTPVRIYAPVGSHKELLAYLVRRLLENGANSSFVNRIADEQVSLDELVRDPVAELEALEPKRNPKIVLPRDAVRRSSAATAPASTCRDPLVREPLLERLKALESRSWTAKPTLGKGEGRADRLAPRPPRSTVGTVFEATRRRGRPDGPRRPCRAGRLGCARRRGARAAARPRPPTSTRSIAEEFFSLCIREAGKTLIDAVLEVREAVDFLRFYASEARRQFTRPLPLPGPTGEQNELRLHGRGRVREHFAVEFPARDLHRPGVGAAGRGQCRHRQAGRANAADRRARGRADAPGGHSRRTSSSSRPAPGRVVGGTLTAHPLLAGVVFTGSTETARMINRTLAERDGPIIPFIAETGGQNAMIVDSSALPEQVTRDVISSAFQSAGQRCSALRVLFVQEDVADGMIAMIAGRDGGAEGRRPERSRDRRRPGHRRGREEGCSTSTSSGSTRMRRRSAG